MRKQQKARADRSQGFTIIELLVVIVVIGILIGLLLPNLFSAQQRGRDADRKNDIKTIQQQLEAYYNDNQHYPADLATLESDDYIDTVPEDPQGGSYNYNPYTDADTESACSTAENCVAYDLVADLENDNDAEAESFGGSAGFYVVESVNQ